MKSFKGFFKTFPTKNKVFNITIFGMVIFVLLIVILLVAIFMAKSKHQTVASKPAVSASKSAEANKDSYNKANAINDVLQVQLRNRENELVKSNSENDLLKKNMADFSKKVDANFNVLQQKIKEMDSRLTASEKIISKTIIDKQQISIVRLDKMPYQEPAKKQNPKPKKGKVLAEVGNVVWIESPNK